MQQERGLEASVELGPTGRTRFRSAHVPALATLLIQLLGILNWLVGLAELLVVISVIISWLVSFDVINIRNRMVYQIVGALDQVTGRLLYPIQRFVPSFGGLDISPLIFFIVAEVMKALIRSAMVAIAVSGGLGA